MSEETSLAPSEGQELHVNNAPQTTSAPDNTVAPASESNDAPAAEEPPKMSKNALKRMRKQQEWEDGREDRAKRRKEKRHERRERWREARNAAAKDPSSASSQAASGRPATRRPKPTQSTLVPLALVLDCDFESYMTDKELISLTGQVVRSYSDNKSARYRSHLWIGGWRGKMKERFEGLMRNAHKGWKGVGLCEGDFVQACAFATQQMASPGAGEVIGPLQRSMDHPVQWTRDEKDPFPLPDPEPEPKDGLKNIVYLTSESPYTLERLEPNTCYIIGGLVDKNREKGLCYRRAREKGVKTARLPIGKFMMMQSRQVLTTNHVVEIMLKWLEFEDWGKAFMAVIPKRKGGTLRADATGEGSTYDEVEDEEDEIADQSLAVDAADAQAAEALSLGEEESKADTKEPVENQ